MERLDLYISNKINLSRSASSKIIENGLVLVNSLILKPSYKLKKDDVVEYDEKKIQEFLENLENQPLEPCDIKLDIIYEDDDVIVINKPKQMLTHPTKFERTNTLANALLYHTKGHLSDIDIQRPGIVHRLDKNTAGLIIAAKNNDAHLSLAEQIKQKTAKRKYLALALGNFELDKGTINKPVVHYMADNVRMEIAQDSQGLEAITDFKVVEKFDSAALVELDLKTGRTHQIRVHLASINHPVWGDTLYGAKGFLKKEYKNLKTTEQLLQSYYICFNHPKTNEKMEFKLEEKDFSDDFVKVLKFLRSKNVCKLI